MAAEAACAYPPALVLAWRTAVPADYRCESCGLRFSLGPFHDDFAGEYPWHALVVCLECGTQHVLSIGQKDWGPEWFYSHDVVLSRVPEDDRLAAMQLLRSHLDLDMAQAKTALKELPVSIKSGLHREDADELVRTAAARGVFLEVVDGGRHKNEDHGRPLPPNELTWSPGPRFDEPSEDSPDPCREGADCPVVVDCEIPSAGKPLEGQACRHCGAERSLVADYRQEPQLCPHCKQDCLLFAGAWVT